MKHSSATILGVFLLAGSVLAIGDQHGVFRSQSTQGKAWKGTATIEEESYRMTVYPD
jgi:hypothetical protein